MPNVILLQGLTGESVDGQNVSPDLETQQFLI